MRLNAFLSPQIITEMRTDSERFEQLDTADRWLAKYTYEGLDRWPGGNVLEILAKRYPIKEPTKVYRGMNFRTKDDYDKFMSEIADGYWETGAISSWSQSNTAVEQFAVTRPSYFLDGETMRLHGEASRKREYVTGYRGIILETLAMPGLAIDVNASKLGHESEIILLPTKIKVSVFKQLKKYADHIDDGMDVNEIIEKHHSEGTPYETQFFEYIMTHHIADLNSKSKTILFNKFKGPPDINVHIRTPYFSSDVFTHVTIGHHYYFYKGAIEGYYNDEDMPKVEQTARIVAEKMIAEIEKHPDAIINIANIHPVVEMSGNHRLESAIKKHIGNQYRKAEIDGRAINQLPANERQNAIYKHTKNLEEIMKQFKIISDR